MTREDILTAVRDGACSKAFGDKCMVQQQVGVDLAACAKQFEKERDDARREVADLRRRFSEASQMAQECVDALAESQARDGGEMSNKELDDARREAEKYLANIEERQRELSALVTKLAESQAREVQTRALLLKLYGTPSTQLLESGYVWIREALATKPNTDALRAFGVRVAKKAKGVSPTARCYGCAHGLPLLPKGSGFKTYGEKRPEHFNGSNQMPCVEAEFEEVVDDVLAGGSR